jgi:hypothetical protein
MPYILFYSPEFIICFECHDTFECCWLSQQQQQPPFWIGHDKWAPRNSSYFEFSFRRFKLTGSRSISWGLGECPGLAKGMGVSYTQQQ